MAWRPLVLENYREVDFFVRHVLGSLDYVIEVTDLSRIWGERLSKDAVIDRAASISCSIDAGEDEEQYQILLSKIQNALDGLDDTSCRLTSSDGSDGSQLQLSLLAPLPGPLPPFKWTVELNIRPLECIESEIVRPLLSHAQLLRYQIQQLYAKLHDKDRIIARICDRLETSGNDLTTVFPGVSNIKTTRKKSQRDQLAQHIRGLEDFDENAWLATQNVDFLQTAVQDIDIKEVFADLRPKDNKDDANPAKNWWTQLDQHSQSQANKQTPVAKPSNQDRPGDMEEAISQDLEDTDFQRQGTPEHLKASVSDLNAHKTNSTAIKTPDEVTEPTPIDVQRDEEDSTTDEDDDLDAPIKAKPLRQPQALASGPDVSASPPRRLGVLGGQPKQPVASSPNSAHSETSQQPSGRASKIGMIGGKKDTVRALAELSPKGASVTEMSNAPPSSKAQKESENSQDQPVVSRSETTAKVQDTANGVDARLSRSKQRSVTPQPRQTSEERADEKRNQLKRELEEKAKVPVKKKRKF